jgi:hypothetical protein
MSQLVTDSPLDWTIARFTRPTDGPRTSNVRAGYLGRDRIRASITRADIANFLLAQTNDTPYHRTAPAISNERHVAHTQHVAAAPMQRSRCRSSAAPRD